MKSYHSSVIDLIESGRFAVRQMLRVELVGGAEGIWNGAHDIVFESLTYHGVAGCMAVDPLPASTEMDADRVRVTISAIDPDALSVVRDADWHQRAATVYDAYLDEAGSVVHVEIAFTGALDSVTRADEENGSATLELSIESPNRELHRSTARVYSNSDQRMVGGPNDGFLRRLATDNAITDIHWGR